LTDTQTRESCHISVADLTVTATGDLTLRAGKSVEIGNGTSVESGGVLTLGREGDLQMAKRVFVTSMTYDGDLGYPSGADAECQTLADAALLSGVFKAWLSDLNEGPADRFVQAVGPYLRVDGVGVADDWEDVTDGTLQAPIRVTETGDPTSAVFAWTNTLANGEKDPSVDLSCRYDWKSDAPGDERAVGGIQNTSSLWTRFGTQACDTPHHSPGQ
jgi:hypothetical protein